MKTVNTTILNYLSNLNFHQILYIICWSLWQFYCILNKRELNLCEHENNTLSSSAQSWCIGDKPIHSCPTKVLCYHGHTEINQQEETSKLKIWGMSDMPQSRNNTKWEWINVLPLGSMFQSQLIIRQGQALLCLKALSSLNSTQLDAQLLVHGSFFSQNKLYSLCSYLSFLLLLQQTLLVLSTSSPIRPSHKNFIMLWKAASSQMSRAFQSDLL